MIAAAAVQVEDSAPTFRELVAAELRAQLARRKMSGRALSKVLGENQTWVSRRLNGVIPIDTDDLDRVAAALGMNPMQLLSGIPFRPAAPQTYEADRAIRRNRRISRHHLTVVSTRDHETTTASAVTSADVTHPQAA